MLSVGEPVTLVISTIKLSDVPNTPDAVGTSNNPSVVTVLVLGAIFVEFIWKFAVNDPVDVKKLSKDIVAVCPVANMGVLVA